MATEKDLAEKLSSDKVINRLASMSPVLTAEKIFDMQLKVKLQESRL